MRFEPGQTRSVRLIPFAGARIVHGFRGETEGPALMPARLSRAAYAGMYGPTTGDRVRLADTDLDHRGGDATSPPMARR